LPGKSSYKKDETIAFWCFTIEVVLYTNVAIALIKLTFGASSASFTHCMSWKKKNKKEQRQYSLGINSNTKDN